MMQRLPNHAVAGTAEELPFLGIAPDMEALATGNQGLQQVQILFCLCDRCVHGHPLPAFFSL